MFNFKPKFIGEESVDRKNRQPKGELPVDEDEQFVDENDPQKKFIKIEDIADEYDFSDHISLEDHQENQEELRFEAELKDNKPTEPAVIIEEKIISEMIDDKYKNLEEAPKSDKIGSESYKDHGMLSKKYIRGNSKHGTGHHGDNLKTMSESKKSRDNRSKIRESLGK